MGSLHRPAFQAALKLLGYTWLHSCFVFVLALGEWLDFHGFSLICVGGLGNWAEELAPKASDGNHLRVPGSSAAFLPFDDFDDF